MNYFFRLIFCLCLFVSPLSAQITSDSWEETKTRGEGTVVVYWCTSRPFIFSDQEGKIDGIEYRVFEGFKRYLAEEHDISLAIRWVRSESFIDVLYDVRDKGGEGTFGSSAFSITEERRQHVNFSPPYMPDISVMISSEDVPIVSTPGEIREVLSGLTAVTIEGTTYESDIKRLRSELNLDFDIEYIPSNDNVLLAIGRRKNAFGFIDLPIYLIEFNKNSSMGVKRQNMLPIKREGYALIYPKDSDWSIPLNEYFHHQGFKEEIEEITSRYLDPNLYSFIEDLYINAEKNVVLLTKEREMQQNEIKGQTERLRKETLLRNYLITAVCMIFIFLLIIFLLYRKVTQDNRILSDQAQKIVSQHKNIERQKEQLEQRYDLLTELNDEKNMLIKVLAHDLRSPINQIQGFANILLLENKDMSETQRDHVLQIVSTSVRVNEMIGKILDVDALESNRANAIPEDIRMSQFIKQVVNSFRSAASAKNINLYFFNSTETDCVARLDRLYLTQVFENLISNAIKFSGKNTNVKISLSESTEKIHISVADEGPGFTDDDKKHLFQKFTPLSARPTSGERSTGLGLSIVKKYVELMEGKIRVESEAGRGATFHIEFPNVFKKGKTKRFQDSEESNL